MQIGRYIPGLFVVLVIAVSSFVIATFHASFDPLVISIIFGMFLGNMIADRTYFEAGVSASLKVFLPVGIALYGSQLVFTGLQAADVIKISAVFIVLFIMTYMVARSFSINNMISILLASGLAVCGASAIAVISPLIGARKEDTSISIISVMMLGLAGMIFYPMIADMLSLTNTEFNFFAGTTLPMLGQVKVAAATYCPECTSDAVMIKLIRISFLIFLVTLAVVLSGKKEKRVSVPWFIVVFVVLAIVFNFADRVMPLRSSFGMSSSFLLSSALAAVGFSVDFDSIIEEGLYPLGAIFLSWSAMILGIYLVRNLF